MVRHNGGVAIAIPTSSFLRGAAALQSLVDAVVKADEHDEADWIEWKGPLDLATKEGCFHVARAVLGIANRPPERAQLVVEGAGYVVVGAEPGALHGLTTVDPAQFGQLIEPYFGGSDGPVWTPTYVGIGGVTVLVVTVEAPKPGDPIHTLRREFDKYRAGTVFVRKHGRTDPADAADMEALQRRLLASPGNRGVDLGVEVIGDVPLSWFDPTSIAHQVELWADAQARKLLEAASEVDRRRRAEREEAARAAKKANTNVLLGGFAMPPGMLDQMSAMSALGPTIPDRRTLAEFTEEVDEWRGQLVEAAPRGLAGRYANTGHGVIRLQVENLGSRFLPDVEIEAIFGDESAHGRDELPHSAKYPATPHPFGKPKVRHDLSSILDSTRFVPPVMPSIGRRTFVEDGSVKVRWRVGDLRQLGKAQSDDVYVFQRTRPEGGLLHGTWTATVPDVDGLVTGAFEIPVSDAAVDLAAVLSAES